MVMETLRDCRWSRPGYLPDGIPTNEHPLSLGVCVRPTPAIVRRPVTEEECANCPHWEAAFSEEED